MNSSKSARNIQIRGLIIFVVLLAFTLYYKISGLAMKPDFDIFNLSQFFGFLILISLFVERATEFFLSLMRSAEADRQDRKISKLRSNLANLIKTDPENVQDQEKLIDKIEDAQDDRTDYRAESRLIALWSGIIIGIFVSMAGVRILGYVFEVPSDTETMHFRIFILTDVLLTGSVLAGGSQAINKIMKVYNSFMSKKVSEGNQKD